MNENNYRMLIQQFSNSQPSGKYYSPHYFDSNTTDLQAFFRFMDECEIISKKYFVYNPYYFFKLDENSWTVKKENLPLSTNTISNNPKKIFKKFSQAVERW